MNIGYQLQQPSLRVGVDHAQCEGQLDEGAELADQLDWVKLFYVNWQKNVINPCSHSLDDAADYQGPNPTDLKQ